MGNHHREPRDSDWAKVRDPAEKVVALITFYVYVIRLSSLSTISPSNWKRIMHQFAERERKKNKVENNER